MHHEIILHQMTIPEARGEMEQAKRDLERAISRRDRLAAACGPCPAKDVRRQLNDLFNEVDQIEERVARFRCWINGRKTKERLLHE